MVRPFGAIPPPCLTAVVPPFMRPRAATPSGGYRHARLPLPIAKREKVFSGRKNALETLFPSSPPSPHTTAQRACAAVLAAFVTRRPIFEGVGVHFCQILAAQRGIFQGRSPLWPDYGRASPIDVEARLQRERREANDGDGGRGRSAAMWRGRCGCIFRL